jgi:hypothetical protein
VLAAVLEYRTNSAVRVFLFPVTFKRLVPVIAALGALAAAAPASASVSEVGGRLPKVPASCPDACQAIGKVSGFQAQVGTSMHPYTMRRPGKIVAFSITLGNPRADQIDFFNKLFGGPPQARLIILRQPRKSKKYLETGMSDTFELQDYLGSTPTFALKQPLTVKKGYIVAISVSTWAPAFSGTLGNDQVWRSSRDPAKCDDVQQDAAQDVLGSQRTYGCLYRKARLLYTATFVPQPKKTTPQKK